MAAPYFDFSVDSVAVSRPRRTYADHGKRFFDLAVLAFAAPVILPVMALMVALVWVTGGKPLYAQERIGRGGRIFRCWKVRTMVRGADGLLLRFLTEDAGLAQEWAVNQKLSRDPRITLIGRILRKTSLDELPQVWNVLRGDMSLVGPRPFTPDQRDLYEAEFGGSVGYYALRPGITGLWQVSRRNEGSFAERAHYDLDYARSLNFFGDLRIFFRTFVVVLRATGR
jgi:lipopolysaccharide/colanic/teichoic acid biosynthesis glycosyltransferase